MDNAVISVIVPICNVEEYLPQCLDAIVNQTMRDIEIILVDDCGTDGSMKIAEQYAERDERITIIRHDVNQGLSAARNTGIANSSAPYIMFVDSDDYVSRDFCENLYRAITEENVDLAMGGVELFGDSYRVTAAAKRYFRFRFPHKTAIDEDVVTQTNCCVWNKIFRKEIIEKHNIHFPVGVKYEDEYWWRLYTIYARSIVYVKDRVYYYRQRSGSIMDDTRKKERLNDERMRMAIAFYEEIKKRGLSEKRAFAIDFFCKMVSLAFRDNSEDNRDILLRSARAFIAREQITEADCSLLGRHILKVIRNGQLETKRRMLGGLISVKEKGSRYRIECLGLPVWVEKYCKDKKTAMLFGALPIYSERAERGIYLFDWLKIKKAVDRQRDIRYLSNLLFRSKFKVRSFEAPGIENQVVLDSLRAVMPFTFIPNPGNCGDLLLYKATLDFFDENGICYDLWDGKNCRDNIVYGGGGIWISNYRDIWSKRFLPIFKTAKKVVILPSSFADCGELTEMFDEKFTVFCREKRSYTYLMQQHTKADIILDHDMAFRATERIILEECETINNKMAQALIKGFSLPEFRTACLMRTDSESQGNHDTDMDLSRLFGSMKPTREEALFGAKLMLAIVNQFEEITTDRLHVAIAASLMGKRVNMIDNTYGKLSGVYEQSMKNMKRTRPVQ